MTGDSNQFALAQEESSKNCVLPSSSIDKIDIHRAVERMRRIEINIILLACRCLKLGEQTAWL